MKPTPKPSRGRGRPAHEPTEKDRAYVKAMSGYGIPQPAICKVMRISEDTLQVHYRHELDSAATEANAAVIQSLHWMATKGRIPAAAIFWAKTRCGWRETVQLGNADGAPFSMTIISGVRRHDDEDPTD